MAYPDLTVNNATDAENHLTNRFRAAGFTEPAGGVGILHRVAAAVANMFVSSPPSATVLTSSSIKSSSASAGVGYAPGAGGAVTQLTSSATAVTLDKVCGQITTVALTTAAAAEEEFTVNNAQVAATDAIILSTTYAGAGTPMLSVKGMAAGSFKIVITNVHAANALNAVMVINFAVVKAVAA